MIPFAALTLNPAMAAFGQPVTFAPAKSQPDVASFLARGVYRREPVEEQIEETGLFHRTFRHVLGIKLSTFPVPPKQGDGLARPAGTPFADGLLPDGSFEVKDVIPDGQGGADLILQNNG